LPIYCGGRETAVHYNGKNKIAVVALSSMLFWSPCVLTIEPDNTALTVDDLHNINLAASNAQQISSCAALNQEPPPDTNVGVEQGSVTTQSRVTSVAQSQLLVFVSFSMPKTALKEWLVQAEKAKARVLIRGLYNGSLRQTIQQIQELVVETKTTGMEIDPLSFTDYGIKSVPAVVLSSHIKSDADFDVVYGNGGLLAALEQIETHGSQKQYVAGYLAQLRGAVNAG